jgi:hypothetical protein
MRTYEDALKLVVELSSELAKVEKERWQCRRSALHDADKAVKLYRLDAQFSQCEKQRMDVLQDLVQFPPHYLQYAELLDRFSNTINVPYSRRVFIMTKYRDGADANSMRNCDGDRYREGRGQGTVLPSAARRRDPAASQSLGKYRVPDARMCSRDRNRRGSIQPQTKSERRHGMGLDARNEEARSVSRREGNPRGGDSGGPWGAD